MVDSGIISEEFFRGNLSKKVNLARPPKNIQTYAADNAGVHVDFTAYEFKEGG